MATDVLYRALEELKYACEVFKLWNACQRCQHPMRMQPADLTLSPWKKDRQVTDAAFMYADCVDSSVCT